VPQCVCCRESSKATADDHDPRVLRGAVRSRSRWWKVLIVGG
jgi:hypothetical protein